MAQDKKANQKETMEVKKSGKVKIELMFDRKYKGKPYKAGTVVLVGDCQDGLSAHEINLGLQLNQLKAVDI